MTTTELQRMSVTRLREVAWEKQIAGRSRMRREELIEALESEGGRRKRDDQPAVSRAGTDVPAASARGKQVIRDVDEHEERKGRSLITRDHEVIRAWAEARGAVPATVAGTEHQGRAGVLRLDFPGFSKGKLQPISWDDWFATFDERGLNFVYQEHKASGSDSNFFILENPDREDG